MASSLNVLISYLFIFSIFINVSLVKKHFLLHHTHFTIKKERKAERNKERKREIKGEREWERKKDRNE